MTPAEIIQAMQQLPQDKELIVAWWEPDAFGITDEEDWDDFVHIIENRFDWSYTHEDIQETVEVRRESNRTSI